MGDLRHAGLHWNNGPSNDAKLYQLPSPLILMLSPEARWRADAARSIGKNIVWRDVPAPGLRPAEIGWQARRAAEAFMVLWREQSGASDIEVQTHCELNLNYERGDNRNDHADLDQRMETIVRFLGELEPEMRWRLRGNRLHFPPFVPDGRAYDRLPMWRDVANQYDVINVHFYGPAEDTIHWIEQHLEWFPTKDVFLSEWWNDETERTLQLMAELAARQPRFRGATYFIGKWFNAPDWWDRSRDLQDSDSLYRLFLNPPVANVEVVPVPKPFPQPSYVPNYGDIYNTTKQVSESLGLSFPLSLALMLAESGDQLQSFARWYNRTAEAEIAIATGDRAALESILHDIEAAGTNDISFGPGHQSWRWSPEFNGKRYDLDSILEMRKRYIEDPYHAVTVALRQLAKNWNTYKPDHIEALARYNKPDGTASSSVRRRYSDAYDLAVETVRILEGSPANPEVPPVAPDPVPAQSVAYDYRTIPGVSEFASVPKGVILHGSRSGRAGNPKDREYAGTASYAMNNSDGLGWNATIGEYQVALHINPKSWGWNARAASSRYLAVEIAQATADEAITDGQVAAFVDWFQRHARAAWPNLPAYFPTHAELESRGETGQRDGKTDVFPVGDERAEALRGRISALLTPEVPPVIPETPPVLPAPGAGADDRITLLIKSVGYLTGDVAERVEVARAQLDDYGEAPAVPPKNATKDVLWAYIRNMQVWQEKVRNQTDASYREFGLIKDEMQRVGRESL